jgi:pyruvate dehydrogenase E2 component (dihydrolipoamide acetyltransferase)
LAREIGVSVNDVEGTGLGGRISHEDVKEHARRILSSIGAAGGVGPAAVARPSRALPDFARWGAVDRQPWTNIRRATAEHLSYAWNQIPHVTQFDKADVTALEELRKRHKERVAIAGGNLTVTAMLVRILATAVHKFPQFNASIDPERGEVVYKKYVNVGVAVDTDRGLLVPVIRNADEKNVLGLARAVADLVERARIKKLRVEEVQGGTFTVTNPGVFGSQFGTPIINQPQVGILGIGAIEKRPVVRDDAIAIRTMSYLCLTFDHRIVDGADADRFMQQLKKGLQEFEESAL